MISGSGNFGEVFVGLIQTPDKKSKKAVAIKCLKDESNQKEFLWKSSTGWTSTEIITAPTLNITGTASIGNLTLANGSITDSSGSISFGDENLMKRIL